MAAQNAPADEALTSGEQLDLAREVITAEAEALLSVAAGLGGAFCEAVRLICRCRGNVIVSGMGKAGLIGQKIAATLASTGTPSHFLHPAEAVHGDLGRVRANDVLVVLSKSGETAEIRQLLPILAELGAPIVAVTASRANGLGRAAAVTLELGDLPEACPLGLAPSTSTTAMLAVGDALALVVSRMRRFRREDFRRYHPAGSLGWQLSRVEHHMRPLERCRVARADRTVRQVFTELSRPGRRSGAILLLDGEGRLSGLFTDTDLARLFERQCDTALDGPIRDVMTVNPLTVDRGALMTDAVSLISERRISELPVVDADDRPLGLLDITDLIGVTAGDEAAAAPDDRRHRQAA